MNSDRIEIQFYYQQILCHRIEKYGSKYTNKYLHKREVYFELENGDNT